MDVSCIVPAYKEAQVITRNFKSSQPSLQKKGKKRKEKEAFCIHWNVDSYWWVYKLKIDTYPISTGNKIANYFK